MHVSNHKQNEFLAFSFREWLVYRIWVGFVYLTFINQFHQQSSIFLKKKISTNNLINKQFSYKILSPIFCQKNSYIFPYPSLTITSTISCFSHLKKKKKSSFSIQSWSSRFPPTKIPCTNQNSLY